MFALLVVVALLGLTSDVSARRLANKDKRDLSVESFWPFSSSETNKTITTTSTTTSAEAATTEITKITDADESLDTTMAASDSSTKPATTAAPDESTEVAETTDADESLGSDATETTTTTTATTVATASSTSTATTTTTTWRLEDLEEDLPDCLSIPTYPGKCSISQHPGACYSSDENETWQCWSDSQSKDTMTTKTCKETVGKQGACVFKDHFAKPSEDDLKLCSDVPGFNSQCHPNTEMWGACYSSDANAWVCIRKDEPADVISHYREGDCKVTPTPGDPTVPYDDVCFIPAVEQIVYKCPSVPTYKAEVPASSCLQEEVSFACFSLRGGVTWECLSSNESVPSCMSAPIPGNEQLVDGESYDGVCVHESSPRYESASSAHGFATRTTTKMTTTTTTIAAKTTTETTETAAKTTTTESAKTPDDTTTPKSGTIKSQFTGVTIAVLFLSSIALLV